jgi:hypothetical protein
MGVVGRELFEAFTAIIPTARNEENNKTAPIK